MTGTPRNCWNCGAYPVKDGKCLHCGYNHWDKVTDQQGNVIAFLDTSRECENVWCRRAISEGLSVHIIPAHTDPRASEVTLSLRTYHYISKDAAVEALEKAWATAGTVYNVEDRDRAYAKDVPVKIAKGVR